MPIIAYPFFAMAIVVKPSGKALPTAKIVKPRYVVLRLVIVPIKVKRSTNKPEHNFVHIIPITMFIRTKKMKYEGILFLL